MNACKLEHGPQPAASLQLEECEEQLKEYHGEEYERCENRSEDSVGLDSD